MSALLADAIEGETSLLESIDATLAEIDETEVLIKGLKEKEAQFSGRRRTMEERVRRFRALIEQAMAITEQSRLRRPTATLSLRTLPPDVVVTDEADIPAEFFVPQPPPPPKLDKKALKAALEQREQRIAFAASLRRARSGQRPWRPFHRSPGATLNNGGSRCRSGGRDAGDPQGGGHAPAHADLVRPEGAPSAIRALHGPGRPSSFARTSLI